MRLESLEGRRMLAPFTVTNLNDAPVAMAGDAPGTLRQAIFDANASPGTDTIDFAAELTGGTITLMGGQMTIAEALSIDARPLGAKLTIDANQQSRIFYIAPVIGEFTLAGLTLTGGKTTGSAAASGGAILSFGSLTLVQSIVSGNSTVGNGADGGGIYCYGALALVQSTVSGNTTSGLGAQGGGVYAGGSLTLTQSTVSGNSSSSSGGGIFTFAGAMLTQSTISGNSASTGAGIFARDSLTLTQSTITNNHAVSSGGGVFQYDSTSNRSISISGSIVADNSAAAGGADLVKDPFGTLTVNYSLIGTQISPNAGGNNVVTNDPQLGPLGDNGGPTQTHPLAALSPAIDKGDPSVTVNPAEFDQRGAPFVRVFDGDGSDGARIDIGAYELQVRSPVLFVVTTTADEYDYSNAAVSLREAINTANGSAGANTISFASALSGATITLGGSELVIGNPLTIDARPLAANVTIDADDVSRIFDITSGTDDFTFGGLTLIGGKTSGSNALSQTKFNGGAIRSITTGSLALDRSSVGESRTMGDHAYGGGIWASGNVTLTQSTVSGNSTSGVAANGGGIATFGNVTLAQSTVSGNSTAGAVSYGGGIYARGNVTLTRSTISDNHATNSMGGGIFQLSSLVDRPFSISGSIVAANTAAGGTDLVPNATSTVAVNYSLIGDTLGTGITGSTGVGNPLNQNPVLGPLAHNGGPTQSHDLLVGSPAIDAGDPSIVFNTAEFDQRGTPFVRVFDGDGAAGARIDMGAIERQPQLGPALAGDYNQNGVVDTADYVVWRKTLNQGVMPFSGADGDGDGTVDQDDYGVWRSNFGNSLPPAADAAILSPTDDSHIPTSDEVGDVIGHDEFRAASGSSAIVVKLDSTAAEVVSRTGQKVEPTRLLRRRTSVLAARVESLLLAYSSIPVESADQVSDMAGQAAIGNAATTSAASIDEVFAVVGRSVRGCLRAF